MLFNDPVFLFLFLPVTLAGFFLLDLARQRLPSQLWLIGASLFFYAYWRLDYTLVLLGSMSTNCLLGWVIVREGQPLRRKLLLVLGVVANLGVIGIFKYLGFFTELLNLFTGGHRSILHLALPLGISFFTFEQITYLVDAYRGTTKSYTVVDFLLFVTFFPRLIAGPIVRPGEIIPQFQEGKGRPDHRQFTIGLTLFLIGLMEKVLIADTFAGIVEKIFGQVATGYRPTPLEGWQAAISYTVQLYFDFSGYSNMAIGLARMFGIILPVNFHSPYRATSLIDFWRRWHISLSRFLRDYLYIPLGGNRKGAVRRYVNLFLTMAIGGLWHGAGLTFLFWGALHGAYLVVNHLWVSFGPKWRGSPGIAHRAMVAASRALTLLCVIVGWVFFRSANFEAATRMLGGMFDRNSIPAPEALRTVLERIPFLPVRFGDSGNLVDRVLLTLAVAALCWAIWGPNAQEWLAQVRPTLEPVATPAGRTWRPSFVVGVALGFGFFLVLTTLVRAAPGVFLYFNF